MEKQILGIHTFYTNDLNQGDYKSIDLLVQLASALYWQKSFGPIGLYTTDDAERQLFKYGIHRLYTFIDVIKYRELTYHPRFWAYNKMQMAYTLSQKFPRVCLLDKDLYIKSRKYFNQDAKILYFHDEEVDFNNSFSGYVNPDDLYKMAELKNPVKDWGTTAFNTAMLYLNESGEIVEEWVKHASEIILNSNKWEPIGVSGDMTFVEQYLLAALCKSRGVPAESYLKSTWDYRKAKSNNNTIETPDWSHSESPEIVNDKFLNESFHIWGLKARYGSPKIRKAILTRVIGDLKKDFPGVELAFEKLFNEAEALLEDTTDLYAELGLPPLAQIHGKKIKPIKKSNKKPKLEKKK